MVLQSAIQENSVRSVIHMLNRIDYFGNFLQTAIVTVLCSPLQTLLNVHVYSYMANRRRLWSIANTTTSPPPLKYNYDQFWNFFKRSLAAVCFFCSRFAFLYAQRQ